MKNYVTGLMAAIAIPLSSPAGWQDLKFSKIPPSKVSYASDGMTIDVQNSASPLIYPLKEVSDVTAFQAELEIDGALKMTDTPFPEDAYMRLGFVSPGKKRMNKLERLIAAKWVKTLFDLAPKDRGIDKIYFFNLTNTALGKEREFPGSKGLMFEHIVAVREPGSDKVTFKHTLANPLPTAAIWISVDGDDTKSSYKLKIKNLLLQTAAKPPNPEKSE